MNQVEAFIRRAAIARGIDPDYAIKVVMTEGGLKDPFQQSNVYNKGVQEPSYGPFQLLMEGGLGEQALRQGIDPRKDWMSGVEFALDEAARKRSWGDWHGVAKAGMSNTGGFSDITKPIGISLASRKSFTDPYVPSIVQPVETMTLPTPRPFTGSVATVAAPGVGAAGAAGGMGNMMNALGSLAGMFGGGGSSHPPSPITHSGIDIERPSAQAASQMLAALMEDRRKRYGLSLMGQA